MHNHSHETNQTARPDSIPRGSRSDGKAAAPGSSDPDGAIAVRQGVEAALVASEKRLQQAIADGSVQAARLSMALEAAGMVTWEWDIPSGAIQYSENLPAIAGGDALDRYRSVDALLREVHPEDRASLEGALERTLRAGEPFECEYRVRLRDGVYHWILGLGRIVIAEGGQAVRVLGVSQEITRRKQAEMLMQLQRDLATALSQITDLNAALARILEMALLIHGVDGGGLYLEDRHSGGFRLSAHRGLSATFVGQVGWYPADSPGARLLQGERALHGVPPELRERLEPVLAREGILGLSVVPLHHEDRLIGCLNLASRHCRDIPQPSRVLIEAIAAQAASAIARIQAEQQRKRLEREILEITDREQARFGQDLHDGLSQQLVSAAFDANHLARQLARRTLPEAERAERLSALLDAAITESRRLARGLYPVKLDAEGLTSALEELAATCRGRGRIVCELRMTGRFTGLDHAAATHLYRIAQEAVNNAVKHSGARALAIELTATGQELRLQVRDDGHGFADPAAAPAGMGLQIMKYRAHSLGGALTVAEAPGGGVVVSCCVPRDSP